MADLMSCSPAFFIATRGVGRLVVDPGAPAFNVPSLPAILGPGLTDDDRATFCPSLFVEEHQAHGALEALSVGEALEESKHFKLG
jgi:hypothetical protein